MIFFFCIDIPDIVLIGLSGFDCLCRFHGGKHGMIHIVVSMLTISADTVKIFITVKAFDQFVNLSIRIKISRICFLTFSL